MARNLKPVLQLFLDPGPAPMLFIASTLLLGMAGNALFDAMKGVVSGSLAIVLIPLVIFALFVLVAFFLRRLFYARVVTTNIKPKRGLVVLVSQGVLENIPATEAIRFHYSPDKRKHALEYCWLLRTPAPSEEPVEPAKSSWMNAQALEEKYRGKVKMYLKTVEMDDPESVSMALEQANQDAHKLKLKDTEMVADITGGTKMMSVGMALASIAAGIELTYLKARELHPDGRANPKAGSEPKRVDINYFRKEVGKE